MLIQKNLTSQDTISFQIHVLKVICCSLFEACIQHT